MKIRPVIAFLLLLLVLVPGAFAQTGGQESPGGNTPNNQVAIQELPIRKDTPVTVHLEGTTPVNLSYKTNGGEVITVTARSLEAEDVLDPVLTIMDATGAVVGSNDDHRTNRTDLAPRDSLIADFNLSDAGRYVIQVAAFDATAQGDVEVTITSGSVGVAVTPEPGGNETIDDRVPDTGAYTYDIVATEGEVVTITVRATDNQLDPKVSLVGSDGSEVASNDDHESNDSALGPYDSQIVNFAIPATDTYTIQITGFAGIGGTFELTINRGGGTELPVNPTPPPNLATPAPADETDVVQGTVNPNDVFTYSLNAQSGDVYTITVQAASEDFDPRVSVYLNNDYITDNDDFGSTDQTMQSTDARISNLILAESGQYDIEVRGYQESSGDFTMTIEHVASNAPTGLPSEKVELGTVQSGETYSFDFDAQEGDWVTISVRALTKDFDPYVALLSSDGTVLVDNDDHGTGSGALAFYDSQITNYHVTTSGTYTIEVTGISGVAGSFGLTISTLR